MKKRIISVVSLILTLTLCFSATTFAKSDSDILNDSCKDQLVSQLDMISKDADSLKVSGSDFEDLYIGEPIFAYEYMDSGLHDASFVFYPIFYADDLVFMATKVTDENGESMQLSDCFVEDLSKYCNTSLGIALIYDSQKCYLVTSENISELCTFSNEVPERSPLPAQGVDDLLNEKKIVFTKLEASQKLGYTQPDEVRSTASLIVPWVSQNPPSNICWAASVACIGNYLTSSSYTAKDIAKSVYGSTSWNQGANLVTALDALYNKYGVRYSRYASNTAPSDSRLYNNISGGYPVYGRWSWTSGTHATVIRGVSTGSYVLVMDPEYGFNVANKSSGVYSYVSGYSGVTLRLIGYGAKLA